jgi:predicted HicB family RNase H-like nuclease
MPKRIQIVARIEPDLRKVVARAMRRKKMTLNALVETALRAYLDREAPESLIKANAKEPR